MNRQDALKLLGNHIRNKRNGKILKSRIYKLCQFSDIYKNQNIEIVVNNSWEHPPMAYKWRYAAILGNKFIGKHLKIWAVIPTKENQKRRINKNVNFEKIVVNGLKLFIQD